MRIPSDETQPTERKSESAESFAGLRVAVTGGTSGLGLALVRELTARGARVAFVARNAERVRGVASEHPGAHGIVGDVSSKEEIYPIAVQIAALPDLIRGYEDIKLASVDDFRRQVEALLAEFRAADSPVVAV